MLCLLSLKTILLRYRWELDSAFMIELVAKLVPLTFGDRDTEECDAEQRSLSCYHTVLTLTSSTTGASGKLSGAGKGKGDANLNTFLSFSVKYCNNQPNKKSNWFAILWHNQILALLFIVIMFQLPHPSVRIYILHQNKCGIQHSTRLSEKSANLGTAKISLRKFRVAMPVSRK